MVIEQDTTTGHHGDVDRAVDEVGSAVRGLVAEWQEITRGVATVERGAFRRGTGWEPVAVDSAFEDLEESCVGYLTARFRRLADDGDINGVGFGQTGTGGVEPGSVLGDWVESCWNADQLDDTPHGVHQTVVAGFECCPPEPYLHVEVSLWEYCDGELYLSPDAESRDVEIDAPMVMGLVGLNSGSVAQVERLDGAGVSDGPQIVAVRMGQLDDDQKERVYRAAEAEGKAVLDADEFLAGLPPEAIRALKEVGKQETVRPDVGMGL